MKNNNLTRFIFAFGITVASFAALLGLALFGAWLFLAVTQYFCPNCV